MSDAARSYVSHLRAYAWILVAAFIVVGLLRAELHSYDPADLEGWEVLPDTCASAIACTPNHPTR